MKKPKGYADGGIVEDDEQPAAPPAQPDYTKALTDYFGNQKTAVDKYGPDEQKATVDYLNRSQNSVGNNVARGAAGFADAIMQGVAGAGNPGFLSNIENRQARQLQNAEEEGKSLNEQNLQGIKEKQSLDQMTTGNPLGASRAAAMRPLLQKIYPTLKPQELDSILQNPSAAEAALGPAATLKGKDIENEWKGAELGLGSRRLAAETANEQKQRELEAAKIATEATNQQRQRELEESKLKSTALENYSKMPWYSRLLHPGIGAELEQESGLGGSDTAKGHPDASKALSWAQSHPTDPRAKEILKRLGQ